MQLRSLSLLEAMAAVWIRHQVKLFIVFHQFIDQTLCSLVMHVVVAGAVYQERFAFEL